ncbi:MAG: flagellar assembly protein A [Spirochaetales bacterium]
MATSLHFKGTLAVEVDTVLLQAHLTLSKEGDLVYDEGAVVRILADAGVTSGFEPGELVEVVQRFAKSKDATSRVLVAKGELPDPPRGDDWIWDELLNLPPEMKELSVKVVKAAGHPEVYNVRVEKVHVQKKVEVKGGLFGHDKQGLETVVESREVREKVLVDPNPGRVFFVNAGTRVAQVAPPRPGKPGLDLTGKPIPPPTSKPAAFYVGKYLLRQRAEVLAESSGFLRIGRNWADIVPFDQHRWEITFSADKTSAFLTLEPGSPHAQPLSADTLLAHLTEQAFSLDRVPPAHELQSLIDAVVHTRKSLFSHPLTPSREGRFEVHFSPDRSQAFLTITKPLGGGEPISLKDLGTKLREANLKGFNFETVKGTITEFLGSSRTELKDFLLATGKPPVRGGTRTLEYRVGFLTEEDLAPLVKAFEPSAQGLEKLEKATPLKNGQIFAVFQTPEDAAGEEGVDVSGQRIPAPPGNEPEVVLLAGVQRVADGLQATQDGLLEVGTQAGVMAFRMRFHQDAVATVTRSPDNMVAHLTLTQGKGSGKRLTRGLIDLALTREQVMHGLLDEKIDEALKAALAGTPVEKVLIAKGIPAGNDLERRLSFPNPLRRDAKGLRRCPARIGEVAAEYQPPAEDEVDGTDVLGNLIPSSDMEIHSLVISEDFEIESAPDGRQLLMPLKNGDLVFDGESISLISQIALASVPSGSGGVKFAGEVMVSGPVESGAYIMAGNVKVRGRVGGALLSSDSNIQVADGIHGEGKAVLRAKKHVSVGFMERSLVMAVGDVHIGKSSLNCTLRVNGKIYQKATGGGIVGGLTKTRLGADVMNLGSQNGVQTQVSFGQDYLIEDQIVAEVKETEKLRESIVHLDAIMRRLSGPNDREKLGSAARKKVLLIKMLEKRNLKLIQLRDKFEPHTPSEIVVREHLYPGVSIESHGRLLEVRTKKTAVRIIFNQQTGHIEELPLD